MRKFALILPLLLMSFLLAGCPKQPTPVELANADYGTYPENYESVIRSYLTAHLKDPSSAQIDFTSSPNKQWSKYWGGTEFGWGVCTRINAKNSFGAYTGYNKHYFLIRDSKVVQHIRPSGESFDVGANVVEQRCP